MGFYLVVKGVGRLYGFDLVLATLVRRGGGFQVKCRYAYDVTLWRVASVLYGTYYGHAMLSCSFPCSMWRLNEVFLYGGSVSFVGRSVNYFTFSSI